ncbi:hypothetical protein GBAR_LOCUS4157 [Geodia barretti]|uniref:DUF3463 domain-containing protein n=1 Tax=Geodia barretti TaxID=519541 RepID=A0AA35R7N5_GEOBA|nr:hypothetical protein GBAR_LOCUS4157 [Geodia barretti]
MLTDSQGSIWKGRPMTTTTKRAKRPMELSVRLAGYILKQKARGRSKFPLVTMLEPLEMCNLACIGCGRIREYKSVLDKMMPVDEAISAVKESGAPIVSIAGGEPTIHPRIHEIINPAGGGKVAPSKYLCWVVHMDGMEEKHDESVARAGVFNKAVEAISEALDRGYRVCTNTTVFRGSDVEDLTEMFRMVSDIGVEGSMISPGYDFIDAPDQEIFLTRQESHELFKQLLDPENSEGAKFYNNPLYLNFLKGDREYQCTAWSNPTYTVMGWRKPCYPLADEHVEHVSELFEKDLWQNYGVGKDPRCSNCMMHCGFESATIFNAVQSPRDWATLIKSGAAHKGGITAA